MIFGGDLVYLTPTRTAYEERLLAPYIAAQDAVGVTSTDLLAIPGNHDWYDSLVEFKRLFVRRDTLAEKRFKTSEARSYFIVQLPGNWWLFCVDLQLAHDLDENQFQFFESAATNLADGDRVVLLAPDPSGSSTRTSRTSIAKAVCCGGSTMPSAPSCGSPSPATCTTIAAIAIRPGTSRT